MNALYRSYEQVPFVPETGDFAPSLNCYNGGITYTVGNVYGKYTKIGSLTYFNGYLAFIESTGTPTNTSDYLEIILPWQIHNGAGNAHVDINLFSGSNKNLYSIHGLTLDNTNKIRFFGLEQATNHINSPAMSGVTFTNGYISFSGWFAQIPVDIVPR